MAELNKFSFYGKIGYKNNEGDVVIEPQFDDGIDKFGLNSYNHTEYAPVSLNGKCGMIHESGNIVIPFEYQEVLHLFDDYFAVRKELDGEKWSCGVIKPDGTIVVPFEYERITKIGHYFECFKEASSSRVYSHTLFDTEGNVFKYSWEKTPVVYNSNGAMIYEGPAIDSKCDYLIVCREDKRGVIGDSGELIVEIEYEDVIIVNSDRIIVRRNDGDSWQFGVLDSKSNIIIDFKYKYITSVCGTFFDCFEESDSLLKDSHSRGERYQYSNKKKESWLNSIGKEVYQGAAKVLSKELLACDKEGKKAVYNYNGKRIVNFLYDEILLRDNYLIVGKDFKVGVLTDTGNVVIDMLYDNIEFVHIDDSVSPKYYTDSMIQDGVIYGSFSKSNLFDTAAKEDRLNRHLIQFVKSFYYGAHISCPLEHYSFNDIIILRTNSYAELFSIEEGIIHNSKFDTVKQLTDLSYVVSKDGKYGVYQRDVHRLIIDCEYDRIIFEGGDIVLVCKDGLWGAKNIISELPSLKVDVPIQFKEISILTNVQNLFGVKHEYEDCNGKTIEEYTIVDKVGKICLNEWTISKLSSMPIFYDSNHILSSQNGKYGFISLDNYVSIPFKYDEVKKRKDNDFDVRIDDKWGVLSLTHGEIVAIKYAEKILENFKDAIVVDAITGREGILAEQGSERIPAIYKYLEIDGEFTFFTYEAYGNWGCLDKNGTILIPAKYDHFEIRGEYIIAERYGDETMILNNKRNVYSEEYDYCGSVYDLFDKFGKLIIGGFRKFEFLEEAHLFKFFFGGYWHHDHRIIDELNYIYDDDCHFEEGQGRWLVTTMNLISVKNNKDGKEFTFNEGKIITVTEKMEDNKIVYCWNCPVDILLESEPHVNGDYMISSNDSKYFAIRISDGKETERFDEIRYINNNRFFIREEDKVGIIDFAGKVIVPTKYIAFTLPVSSFLFGISEDELGKGNVDLFDFQSDKVVVHRAITDMETSVILDHVLYGLFIIQLDDSMSKLKSISTCRHSIFDEEFKQKINEKEKGRVIDKFSNHYWFSNDWRLAESIGTYYINDRYYDDTDYERDTWDAMTDGMYGDMPDDFDGDYSFLGF